MQRITSAKQSPGEMSPPEPEILFLRYRDRGDVQALGRVFDLCADELYRVALHLSRNATEAEDLLQSTFLTAMESPDGYDDERRLMPWLLGILSNKLHMNRRRDAQEIKASPGPSAATDPAKAAEQSELCERLDAVLVEVSPSLRPVLVLHLQHGLGAHEIARALDQPKGTVRSQISRGMEEVRRRLPASFAGVAVGVLLSRETLASVRQTVLSNAPKTLGGSLLIGSLMTLKTKLTLTTISILALWASLAFVPGAVPMAAQATREQPETTRASSDSDKASSKSAKATQRDEIETILEPSGTKAQASLIVEVKWHDGTPAHDVEVVLLEDPDSKLPRTWHLDRKRARTQRGKARFSELKPGKATAFVARDIYAQHKQSVELEVGSESQLNLTIEAGIDVQGRVLTKDGTPIPGAVILLGHSYGSRPVGAADGAGRFSVRSLPPHLSIGAASPTHQMVLWPKIQAFEDPQAVELKLEAGGRTLRGEVHDTSGLPIPGASVFVGFHQWERSGSESMAPPRTTESNAQGRFVVEGLLKISIPIPIYVSAPGYTTWTAVHHVSQVASAPLSVELQRAVILHGQVTSDDWITIDKTTMALLHASSPRPGMAFQGPEWARPSKTLNEHGEYRFEGLPPGEISATVVTRTRDRSAFQTFDAEAGETIEWNPKLTNHAILGLLTDARGKPLGGWRISAQASVTLGHKFSHASVTDASGRFRIDGCLVVDHIVSIRTPGGLRSTRGTVHEISGVTPSDQLRTITLPANRLPSASVLGFVELAEDETARISIRDRRSFGKYLPLSNGAFEIPGLCPGRYWLQLLSATRGNIELEPIDLRPDQALQLGTLAWPRPGILAFSALDASGDPTPVRWCSVRQVDGETYWTLSAGTPLLVVPGRWVASAMTETGCFRSDSISLEAGETRELILTPLPWSKRRVRFDTDGLPKMTLVVRVLDAEGKEWHRQHRECRPGEAYPVNIALPIGQSTFIVERPDGVQRKTSITVTPDASDEVIDIMVR